MEEIHARHGYGELVNVMAFAAGASFLVLSSVRHLIRDRSQDETPSQKLSLNGTSKRDTW